MKVVTCFFVTRFTLPFQSVKFRVQHSGNNNIITYYEALVVKTAMLRVRPSKKPWHFAIVITTAAADPDLELSGGGGGFIYLPCRLFSVLSFLLFLPKIRGVLFIELNASYS